MKSLATLTPVLNDAKASIGNLDLSTCVQNRILCGKPIRCPIGGKNNPQSICLFTQTMLICFGAYL